MISFCGGDFRLFCSSNSHSSFFTDVNGRLLAFGKNGNGQLGVGDHEDRSVATLVKSFDKEDILGVSSGWMHSLFLTKDDHNSSHVYACGTNVYGQLGCVDVTYSLVPVHVDFFADKEVAKVIAGEHSSYILTSNGTLFVFGSNREGQLGIGKVRVMNKPQMVEFPADIKIVSVTAGYDFAVALGSDGQAYTFGSNYFGQLGREGSPLRPGRVEALEDKRVMEVMCGTRSTIVVVGRDEIYSFGCNDDGRLGINNTASQRIPQRISFFNSHPIKLLSVGGWHSVALLEDGDICSFGRNKDRQLLAIDGQNRKMPAKVEMDGFQIGKVIDIKCGRGHTLLVTEEGKCFGVGSSSAFDTALYLRTPLQVAEGIQFRQPEQSKIAPHMNSASLSEGLPFPPPASSYALEHILVYILGENFGDKLIGATSYSFVISDDFGDIARLRLDGDFVRLRCPNFQLDIDHPPETHLKLETPFTERMKETLLVALYVGKTETAQSMALKEMIGLHSFLSRYSLCEELRVAIEKYLRKEVDLSLKTAVNVIVEAYCMDDIALVEYPLAIVGSRFLEAAIYINEVKSQLPCDITALIAQTEPKIVPIDYSAKSSDKEEPIPKEVLSKLYKEALSGISGDIRIRCGDVTWNAHRFVLVARSSYFREREMKLTPFEEQMALLDVGNSGRRPRPSGSIDLPADLIESFPHYLHHLYTGDLSIDPEDSLKMLPSVKFFLADEVAAGDDDEDDDEDGYHRQLLLYVENNAAANFVVSLENCIEIINVADGLGLRSLSERALEFASDREHLLRSQLENVNPSIAFQIMKRACIRLKAENDELRRRS